MHNCLDLTSPVYVSAQILLISNFNGSRTEMVMSQAKDGVTNFWPFLKERQKELKILRDQWKTGFLRKVLPDDPLSARLWTNPDDLSQVQIAMRHVQIGSGSDRTDNLTLHGVADLRSPVTGMSSRVGVRRNGFLSVSLTHNLLSMERFGRLLSKTQLWVDIPFTFWKALARSLVVRHVPLLNS